MARPPLVELDAVSLRRPTALILRDVSLRLDPGEAVVLLGANGSGKSTLLRVAATLLAPTGGSGSVLGAALGTHDVAEVRPAIALIGHGTALRPGLTLGENLALVGRLAGRGDPASVLMRVGLSGATDRRVEHCSNGMLRRADLARLFFTRPTLALLDEPHVGLDVDAAPLVDELIAEVRSGGGGVILVTHDAARRSVPGARVLTIRGGSLVEEAP